MLDLAAPENPVDWPRWRKLFRAVLAAARSELFYTLLGLDEATLSQSPVVGEWTAKDLLAHLGHWDAIHTARMALVRDGRSAEIRPIRDLDAVNAALDSALRPLSVEQALAVCLKERSGFLATFDTVHDATLHATLRLADDWQTTVRSWVEWRYRHDLHHLEQMQTWRASLSLPERRQQTGPKPLLRAALKAARRELLTTADLIPPGERQTRPVHGDWTLKDVSGHLADWDLFALKALAPVAAEGRLQRLDYDGDYDRFSEEHAMRRQTDSWPQVWGDLRHARQQLIELLDRLTQEQIEMPLDDFRGRKTTVYYWMLVWLEHEREHAADLRRSLALPGLPALLSGGAR